MSTADDYYKNDTEENKPEDKRCERCNKSIVPKLEYEIDGIALKWRHDLLACDICEKRCCKSCRRDCYDNEMVHVLLWVQCISC